MLLFLFQYDSLSFSFDGNPMHHTLDAYGDFSLMNAADLKIRIEEMLRIKVCGVFYVYDFNSSRSLVIPKDEK